jgi:hypothetical protein
LDEVNKKGGLDEAEKHRVLDITEKLLTVMLSAYMTLH